MKQIRLNERDLSVLRINPLFRDLEPDRFERQLQVMKAEKAHSEKGEMIQSIGEPIRRFGIVLSGAVQVCVDDIEGNRMIMAEVAPGNSFGESLCFLRTKGLWPASAALLPREFLRPVFAFPSDGGRVHTALQYHSAGSCLSI